MENLITPRLPPEIECTIFEIAARSAEPPALERINLLLVSKRTQYWIEPIVYQTLLHIFYVPGSQQATPPVPPSKLHFLRHLYLDGASGPETFVRSMLRGCRNLTALSVLSPRANSIFTFILDGNLPFLKRLAINLRRVFKDLYHDVDIPVDVITRGLGSLTHLELYGLLPTSEIFSVVMQLPNLTHLGFFGAVNMHPFTINTILSSSLGSRLQVLTITSFQSGDTVDAVTREYKYEGVGVDDIRLVCLKQPSRTFMQEHLNEVRGTGIGTWRFAEGIIEERMRKRAAKDAGEVQI
ncbi:hypothetical protein BDN72DRAFT_76902 [Pluteus cervinus]|uniref:Uncharacterized protein n=1 Tax=Pluteus cervinus TaxID=181527 RepID=A0ACD3B8P9_9AGAR|nr:hypothetical protein BDN72DRAFT_76902 [Pluteus cervinus]